MVDPTAALPCTESRSSSSGKEQDSSGTRTGSAARPPSGEAGGIIKIAYLSLYLSMHLNPKMIWSSPLKCTLCVCVIIALNKFSKSFSGK